MNRQIRHKPESELKRNREIVVVCPALRSNVNLSRLVRLLSCAGVGKLITSGNPKVDSRIARDGADQVEIVHRRSLEPVLKSLKSDGFQIVGLEQTDQSHRLFGYEFQRKTALLIGHERHGISEEQLAIVDECIEIPVYGLPYSYNVVTATTMAIYEYCRQFPEG